MRLASEDIVITLPPEVAITLVPTLRAAYRLERAYDGFQELLNLVADGNLTAISLVIREGAGDHKVTRYLDDMPLRRSLNQLVQPCQQYILALAGADDAAEESKQTGKIIPHAEYYAELFRRATGVLGWTPEDAWEASPAEITEAYKGRAEFVKDILAAIFGGKGDEAKPADISDSDTRRRLNAIGNLANVSMP